MRPDDPDHLAVIQKAIRVTNAVLARQIDWTVYPDGPIPAATSKSLRKRKRIPRVRVPDGLLTMAEAAAKLGCSTKTLEGYVKSRVLKYVPIGHGTKRLRKMIVPADIDAFIEAQTRKDIPLQGQALAVLAVLFPVARSSLFRQHKGHDAA